MGDEAEYLESQSDDGAAEDCRNRDREQARRMRNESRIFRRAVKHEIERQLKKSGVKPKQYKPRGKMIERVCKCGCGEIFDAREADVKRGWGLFASKSCAAKYKDRMTGGVYRNEYGT